jgi:hypothetical protein
MVPLLPSRRRAAQLARALDGGAPQPGKREHLDADLQRLLDTVTRLAAVPVVEPRPEFRDSLRARLVEAASAELPAGQPQRAPHADHPVVVDSAPAARRRRRLVAAATGLVLAGAGTGVAAASEQALPGEVLYPVKRVMENVEVSLAEGLSGEGRALLERATTRLDEAQAVSATLDGADLPAVESALTDFTADASGGGERLLEAYAADGDPADLQALRRFAAGSHQVLSNLAERLPPAMQPELMSADETVVSLDGLAARACPDCTAALPLLTVQVSEVSLPQLGPDASPFVPGRTPLTLSDRPGTDQAAQRRADREPRERSPARKPKPADADLVLPDVGLNSPDGKQQLPQDDPTRSPDGGGTKVEGGLQLDLGDVLGGGQQDPAPSQQQPQNGGSLPGVDDVTEPLPSLLDRPGDLLDAPGKVTGDLL